MSNHRVTYIGALDRCQARCSCEKRSEIGSRGDVEEWHFRHTQEVERIRAHLGSRNPSLKSQRDWFVLQAENTDNSYDDRTLWRQLAEEVDRHIARSIPVQQTEVLF